MQEQERAEEKPLVQKRRKRNDKIKGVKNG